MRKAILKDSLLEIIWIQVSQLNNIQFFLIQRIHIFLGEVPQELQDLTDIEEMLISQIFPVVSVYKLPRGQYAYQENVINFSQDVKEFITHLLRDPSLLDLLIVQHYTENESNFYDFQVHQEKIICALQWLKANNIFYCDIDIDDNILQALPINGSIADQLPQFIDNEEDSSEKRTDWIEDDNENDEIYFSQTFVSSLPTKHNEDNAINEILNRMNKNLTIDWPYNEVLPINEFHTPGYMVQAFPTLYP